MKRDNVNYLMVGTFVLVMLVAFFVFLFAITGSTGPSDRYVVYYENVSGVKFGTSVFYEGYQVGQVESLTPEPGETGMRYRLDLSIAAGWRIPEDSVASVASSGLISAISINIREGESATALKPGATITGEEQADMFAALNQAASDFRALSRDGIVPVLKNVDQRISEVAAEIVAFRRDDLSPLVTMLHHRLDKEVIATSLQVLDRLDSSSRGLQVLLGEVNQRHVTSILTHVDDVAVNLNTLISQIEATRVQMNGVLSSLGAMADGNRSKVDDAMTSAQSSMEELDIALKKLNSHLAPILHNVESGSRNMNEFARSIRDNPARLIRNSETAEPGGQ